MEFSTLDLSWLPPDADEQLALGFRVVSNAYKTRVSGLESEIRSLKSGLSEKSDHLNSLQSKYNSLEEQLVQLNQRGNQLFEENKNLLNTVKKLQKDLDRLENLKKVVLSSFQDEMKEVDGGVNRYFTDDVPNTFSQKPSTDSNRNEGPDAFLKGLNLTSVSRPLQGNPPSASYRNTVDGRQFFKNAKNLLSPEDFSSFLSTIKKFNAQMMTRDETLAHAMRVFGEHSKAFEEFKQLLNPKN
ncbi:uncharacterized protein TA18020 [Theileria annulata]|uniref:At4g15545-like C-terminal domain-containing protein n=1 Tax=Theileria annulata TaxID=5874 RepID=Q4UB45_THEAN|nr:uncharacterized protein TA18020 [Theileria annulata]CAI75956.1 hypothetical protein, conserved [Theileria annulata]|eukprot:XP_955432.1 hypothetical protein, conserved [Theileria annulata]